MPMWCVSNDPCGICRAAGADDFLLFFADYVVVFSVLHPWFGAEGSSSTPFASWELAYSRCARTCARC